MSYLIINSCLHKRVQNYTSLSHDELEDVLTVLKSKIIKRKDVEGYLLNGAYIKKSLFPEDLQKDKYYGKLVSTYLEEYKYFKTVQLRKNIKI